MWAQWTPGSDLPAVHNLAALGYPPDEATQILLLQTEAAEEEEPLLSLIGQAGRRRRADASDRSVPRKTIGDGERDGAFVAEVSEWSPVAPHFSRPGGRPRTGD
jgi:hypothetical protein